MKLKTECILLTYVKGNMDKHFTMIEHDDS